jgi:hypothetical protein
MKAERAEELAAWKKYWADLNDLLERQNENFGKRQQTNKIPFYLQPPDINDLKASPSGTPKPIQNTNIPLSRIEQVNLLLAQTMAELRELPQLTQMGIMGLADSFSAFGQALVNGEDAMQAFGESMKNMLAQVIGELLKAVALAGVLSLLSGGISGGGFSFFEGLGNILGGKIPGHAAGGIAYGPSLGMIGEYANAGSNPEVIAPLSKLKGMLGGAGSGTINVVGKISGNDILLLNARAVKNQRRTS